MDIEVMLGMLTTILTSNRSKLAFSISLCTSQRFLGLRIDTAIVQEGANSKMKAS